MAGSTVRLSQTEVEVLDQLTVGQFSRSQVMRIVLSGFPAKERKRTEEVSDQQGAWVSRFRRYYPVAKGDRYAPDYADIESPEAPWPRGDLAVGFVFESDTAPCRGKKARSVRRVEMFH